MADGLSGGGGSGHEGTEIPGHLSMLLQELARAPGDDLHRAWQQRLQPGDAVGRFEIIREIGRGGFGVVYEALDRQLGRSVAFKTLRPVRTGHELSADWILKEAEAVARLDHPAIVTLHDVGRCESGPYLVEELLRGETLGQRLRGGPLAAREAVAIGLELARGLAHAHGRGVLHRDLKPGNVFLTEDGRVKLLDFGLAHLLGTRGLHGAGTPAYMAPEQLRGETVDARADVFALGATLFEALAGKAPFPVKEGRSGALDEGPLQALPEGIPVPLARLVERCLSKDPAKRPASGQAVVEELLAVQRAVEGGRGAPDGVLASWLRELRRRRVFRALIGWGIASFAILQVIEPVMHGLHLPEWTLSVALVTLGLGFPVTVLLAWVFDLKATGVERTGPAPAEAVGAPHPRGARVALVLVGLGLVAAAPGVVYLLSVRGGRPVAEEPPVAPGPQSVAVLAFVDMSPGKDQEYFADGIAEEILNALAQVESLHVSGRTSSFSFKGKPTELAEIGRRLNVATVLEGSVRKAGSRVRITAQLVNASDGFHLWSRTFDRDLTDVFAVQEEIARDVVEELEVKLLSGRAPSTKWTKTSNPEAHDQYLLGRDLLRHGSLDNDRRALTAFEKAIALDPGYGPAWAGVAFAIVSLHGSETDTPYSGDPEGRGRALAAAERAISLAPDLGEGYRARALVRRFFSFDWAGAQADVERALALSPGDALATASYASLLGAVGRLPEAIGAASKATRLDPLVAAAWFELGAIYNFNNDFDRARAALNRALEISPDDVTASYFLSINLVATGRAADALALAQRSPVWWIRLAFTALAQHDLGNVKESQAALDELVAMNGAYQVVQVYAWRGERDRAFEWLERSYAVRDTGLHDVKNDPLLRRLHDDPRWKPFLRKMNLPVD